MKLFLDHIRNPRNCASYMHKRTGALNLLYIEKIGILFVTLKSFKKL